jgi:hypothetical protein
MGKAWVALVIGVVLGLIPSLTQRGWAAGQPVIFYACVNAQTGFLYNQYKGTHPRCRAGDTVTSWNQAGPRGFQGPAGPGAAVKDANGAFISVVLTEQKIIRQEGSIAVTLRVTDAGLQETHLYLNHGSTNCSGVGYLQAADAALSLLRPADVRSSTAYYAATEAVSLTVHSASESPTTSDNCGEVFIPPNICCHNVGGSSGITLEAYPAEEIDLSPFVPPFHVEVQE